MDNLSDHLEPIPGGGWRIVAPVEAPHWQPELILGVLKALDAAGLALDHLTVTPVASASPGYGVEADREGLIKALADLAARALLLSGVGERWQLRLPLDRGWMTGWLAPAAVPEERYGLADSLATLFDAVLCEWGVAGPDTHLAAPLAAAVFPPRPEDPNPLPAVAPLTYLSPDLTYQADIAGLMGMTLTRRLRSVQGGLVLISSAPAVLDSLATPLASALRAVTRPAIEVYHLPGLKRMRLRDVSPGLARWQATACASALSQAGLPLTVPIDLHMLGQLDARLGPAAASLRPEVREGWSACAGQVGVAAGGRWRRILDPWLAFPANLLVELPSRQAFNPHAELERQLQSGVVAGLGGLVESVLSQRG